MGKQYTEAQKKAILKYVQNKTKICITIDHEQKDMIQNLAQAKGMSVTQLIIALVEKEKGGR